ncbi:hypothetical protein QH494_19860 [Sphingomonas sp. AR_OL41]|uniref:hypothetical protein n=1 Tax=Sphingomonas sp. AR_OL41 TaxID=3042729 RepID=UPI00247FDDBB|nr:hypothetical protein [Sphingomonas sp. AR_OL41]MDH7974451.1 hypothetical protein [Sphingomonas sp. AR_OL41]
MAAFTRLIHIWFALALIAGCAAPALAAERKDTSLIIALYAKPADRVALRNLLEHGQADRLRRWKADGVLAGYRLIFTRYADTGMWDAMEQLTFADDAALARWNAVERQAPAGLDTAALALVTSIETTPAMRVRNDTAGAAQNPVMLVIPYQALVPPGEYLGYLDGYTIPQFRGWMEEGVLQSYDILTSAYPAGRAWNAMIMLNYRDDAALARRDTVVSRVRARLALDPAWKAISDNKKAIRSERVLAIADQIASDEPR